MAVIRFWLSHGNELAGLLTQYDAVPIVRTASLLREPAIGRALARLAGRVSEHDMRAMNAAVDLNHRDVRTVVSEFLARLPPSSPIIGR